MAHWKNVVYDSFPAAEDLSSAKGLAGVLNASGQVAIAGAAALPAPGYIITEEVAAAAGTENGVALLQPGVRYAVEVGGTTAVGDDLTPAADGQFVTATSGEPIWGVALDVGADGETITMVGAAGQLRA